MNLVNLKILPNNLEAEMALLGSIIIEPESISKVIDYIWQKDFFNPKHAKIWRALCSLWNETTKIDLISLTERLEHYDDLTNIGGEGYLLEISNVVPTSSHIIKYAKIIKENSIKRQLISSAESLIKNSHNKASKIDELFEGVEHNLDKIHKDYEKSFKQTGMDFDKAFESVLERRCPSSKGIKCGINIIDDNTIGLKSGQYWIFYGYTGIGKSWSAVGMSQNILKQEASVRFLSLEMSADEIWDRLITVEQKGDKEDSLAYDRVKDYKFIVEDNIRSIGDIGRYIKQNSYNTDVFFVDYLGMIRNKNTKKETESLIESSQELSHFAKKYKTSIICFAQTNMEAMSAGDWDQCIRGGVQVAAPADLLVRIKRINEEKEDAFGRKTYMKYIVQKNRHGRGVLDCMYPVSDKSGFIIY